MKRLDAHLKTLFDLEAPVVACGDYNVIPTDLDVYKPANWKDDALFAPEAKAAYARFLEQGWTDAIRHLHAEERIYSFWAYWRRSFERDAGIRIDHLLLNKAAGVDTRPRGWEKSSDHAPAWIELGEPTTKRPGKA